MAAEEKDAVTFGETVTASEFDLSTDHGTPLTAKKSSASRKKTNSKSSGSSGRTRVYAKIVYPSKEEYESWYRANADTFADLFVDESTGEVKSVPHYDGADGYGDAPMDWKEVLADCHVPAVVSPLHAFDLNPDGTIKKPHYHVMILFDGVKTQKQADEIFDKIHGVGREEIGSTRGYARYMLHMDNPEKFRYTEKPLCMCGVDFNAIVHLPTDDIGILRDMLCYIRTNHIVSFAQFMDICMVSNEDWFAALATRSAYIVKEYIKSLDWESKQRKG